MPGGVYVIQGDGQLVEMTEASILLQSTVIADKASSRTLHNGGGSPGGLTQGRRRPTPFR
jgi:hypothetical protein